MAHLGAIRAVETRQMSGLAMQSEYMLLDAKLSEKAKNLELSEENIFRLFGLWQGQAWDGEIKYPTAFHIKDKNIDMEIIQKAAVAQRDSATATPKVKTMLDNKIVELLADDDEEIQEMQHPVTTPENRSQHIKEMIMEGLTDQQMLQLHPEINQADITTAKQELLNLNNASTSPTQTPTD